ncbi:Protein of unknown function [Methylobacillus rhizosphaerae]|uniref:DUF2934 domain-containing protein n=1 Tax=Methylobacillus rhizosphaerae TaxID=551994 RepID=A0A238YG68_9PROT|nr:DUF2934 domain-containing protein [Methylobacillus rhizosphaerae]SNR69798.1 Protein of unknown function [Methylobacillus rhizosphaerae]
MATPKSTTVKKSTTPEAVVAKPAAARKTVSRKTSSKAGTSKAAASISAEERYRMIEVAAYFLAESNGFSGDPIAYWATAEAQINSQFN